MVGFGGEEKRPRGKGRRSRKEGREEGEEGQGKFWLLAAMQASIDPSHVIVSSRPSNETWEVSACDGRFLVSGWGIDFVLDPWSGVETLLRYVPAGGWRQAVLIRLR